MMVLYAAQPILTTWEWIGLIAMLGSLAGWMTAAYAKLASMDTSLRELKIDFRQYEADHGRLFIITADHERRISVNESEINHLKTGQGLT